MKVKELFDLRQALDNQTILGLDGTKLSYAIHKNRKLLKHATEAYNVTPPASYIEYRKELTQVYQGKETEEEKKVKAEALKEKYAKTLELVETLEKEFETKLEGEVDTVVLHKVKASDLPENLNAMHLQLLDPMLVD